VLASGEELIERWRQLGADADLDRLDSHSRLLLPLAFRNLSAAGWTGPQLGRLRGMYRHAWSRNQLLFRNVGRALEVFHARGIEAIVLRAGAIDVLHYRDLGVRTAYDPALLVPGERAADAIAVLERLGWRPLPAGRGLAAFHGQRLSADGFELELRSRSLATRALDDAVWSRAVPVEISGVEARAPSPPDMLLHLCLRGAFACGAVPVRWVCDALTVIGTAGPELDWQAIPLTVGDTRLAQPLAASLRYLRECFSATVPEEVIADLETSARWPQRAGYAVIGRLPTPLRVVWLSRRDT
jgi:hypothetical protein